MKWKCPEHGTLNNTEVYAIYIVPVEIECKVNENGTTNQEGADLLESRPHHLISESDVPEIYCVECGKDVEEIEDEN